MLIAGVDEAGKGPVIGPMIVAGVVIEENRLPELKKLGVKDSKALTPMRRNYLASKIRELVTDYYILEVSARQIDEFRKIMTMNQVMVICHAKVLDQLGPEKAYLDASDVNEKRFGENVGKKHIASIEIIAKHKSDDLFPIVSAASILAKVRRDRCVREIEKKIGLPLGSGYPSDPKTRKFLENWIKEHGSLPDIVRHSWKTSENLLKKMLDNTHIF